ncbi:uncharacterized protein LOC131878133 [Tigriopus californicus]|uniref:uncharacterized protein LOC131878133 n=1 Tax=Tigriopus californicus TaxID=6832 RepID=UPI0027DAB1F7|nr:uncharacterized protein LOC131878133 [Tigriopus californicus]
MVKPRTPLEGVENIFVSSKAIKDGSKAIRGGIPVCFPSFGPWEHGPQHGFARSTVWAMDKEPETDPNTGDVKVMLSLKDDEKIRETWNYPFQFLYTFTLKARDLILDVNVANQGERDLEFTFALHTYYKVPDVTQCTISGLQGLTYLDKTDGGKAKKEEADEVKLSSFADRVYQKSPDSVVLRGLQGGRALTLTKTNLTDTVVWNPWAENAKNMADFGDDEYTSMICVEAVQFTEPVSVKPNSHWQATHSLAVMD